MPQVFLMVLHALDPNAGVTIGQPPAGFGDAAFGDVSDVTYFGIESTIYWSDKGYTSKPTDVPANQEFAPRLVSPLSYEFHIFEGDSYNPAAQMQVGVIQIATGGPNPIYAMLENLEFDGRAVEIYRGDKAAAFSTFTKVFSGFVDHVDDWDDSVANIVLRDRRAIFDKPLQSNLYLGTGGKEGTSELAGKPKPIAIGGISNASAVPVDGASLIYQLHDGIVSLVTSVRDKGVALTAGAGVSTYDDLVAAPVAAGTYVRSATGHFKLGAVPAGEITVGFAGKRKPIIFGPTYANVREVVQHVVMTYLGDRNFALDEIVEASAEEGLEDLLGSASGAFYTGTDVWTVAQVLDRAVTDAMGFWGLRLDGKFTYGVLSPGGDDVTDAVDTLGPDDIIGSPKRRDVVPVWQLVLEYGKNWTVQGQGELADSVSPDDRRFYSQEYQRDVRYTDEHVRQIHLAARQLTVSTANGVNAVAAFAPQFARLKRRTGIWQLQARRSIFDYQPNDLIALGGLPLINGGATKGYRLVGAGGRSSDEFVNLWLWG